MCCEHGDDAALPAVVRLMLDRYRARALELGLDWGDETPDCDRRLLPFVRHADPGRVAELTARPNLARIGRPVETGGADEIALLVALLSLPDPLDGLIRALPASLAPGLVITRTGGVEVGHPLPFAVGGTKVPCTILGPAEGSVPAQLSTAFVTAGSPDLSVDGHSVRVVEPVAAGKLQLISDAPSRWSVVDERGGGWYPEHALPKRDIRGRPFFHGNELVLDVPAGRVTVRVARGCEFLEADVVVDVAPDQTVQVELAPERLYDGAAQGWYGADLHVHMNYGGLVCSPAQACSMQQGEGLHLMSLVAGNQATALIYDREAFESSAGQDLPRALTGDSVARFGVEYRNDLLGHFGAFGATSPPVRYQTGHPRSENVDDWPPNSVAAEEFRDAGATVHYTHPMFAPMSPDGSPDRVFADVRPDWLPDLTGTEFAPEARELVADAALGLVDSVDIVGVGNREGTEALYHRLLSCGLRLAATAGTDSFLSQPSGPPPGWARAYADLRGAELSVAGWQEAQRAGRTFGTTGPWLEFGVAGRGLGETVETATATCLPIRAKVVGHAVRQLEVVGPDGVLASVAVGPDQREAMLEAVVDARESLWLAAVARGDDRADGLGQTYAHTSPIWVAVGGLPVTRPTDATWCLDWLDRFEAMIRRRGTFSDPKQLADLVDVIDRARAFYAAIVERGRA